MHVVYLRMWCMYACYACVYVMKSFLSWPAYLNNVNIQEMAWNLFMQLHRVMDCLHIEATDQNLRPIFLAY